MFMVTISSGDLDLIVT